MKRTSTLLLSLLVIANIAIITPVQATPWETFKNAAVKTGTFIKKGVKSVATGIKDNIISPSKIALGTLGVNLGINEAFFGSAVLAISTVNPATMTDFLMSIPSLAKKPEVITTFEPAFKRAAPLLKGTGILMIGLSIPTILLSLQAIKSGVQDLQKANAPQHD